MCDRLERFSGFGREGGLIEAHSDQNPDRATRAAELERRPNLP